MRFPNFLQISLLIATTTATASDQEPISNHNHHHHQQLPQHPPPDHLPVMMPVSDNQAQPSVLLIDILGTQRSLTTFFSLSRIHEVTNDPLSDANTNTIVLAPDNIAIENLPRKPWENPSDYDSLGSQAYDGSGGKDRADDNLRKFVQAHLVVGASPWEVGVKAKTVAGTEIWWETKKDGDDEKRVIMPDGVDVDRVASRVANGEVWILKGVLSNA